MLPRAVDVLVVGGGVAGLSTARCLAEGGASVLVAEAGTVGAGASGQGGGQVLSGLVEAPHRILDALGRRDAQVLYDLGQASARALDGWGLFEERGGWWIALDDREAQTLPRSASALGIVGIEVHADRHPTLDRPGLRLPGEGAVASGAIAALVRAVESAGGTIAEDTRVDRIDDRRGCLEAILGDEVLATEIVVYAAGATAAHLEGFFADTVTPVREQALSCAGPAVPSGRGGHGYTWWRNRDGALWVGGCRWATPHLEVGQTEAVVVDRIQDRIEAFAAGLIGSDPEVDRRWAWIEAHTCDGLPLIGPLPGAPRRVACLGFGGNDWGLAPAAAQSIADGLLRETGPPPTPLFAPSRLV